MNCYTLEDGTVYLTYSTTARGLEFMMVYYGLLDRTPLGRNEVDDEAHCGCAATTSTTATERAGRLRPHGRPALGFLPPAPVPGEDDRCGPSSDARSPDPLCLVSARQAGRHR